MVVLVIDVLVLWVVMADFSVRNGLRGELLDGGLDVRPVVIFELLDESVSIVGHRLVRSEARVDHGTHVNTEGSVEDTGLEVGGGGGGNSAVANRGVPPRGEGELLAVAHSLACTVIVTSVPLGCCILHVSLDGGQVFCGALHKLVSKVRVSLGGTHDGFLVVPLISDILICWVGFARSGIGLDLWGELLDSRYDGCPLFGFEGRNESICVISQSLVRNEALLYVGTHVNTKASVEDTGLEVGKSGGWNSALFS